MEFQSQFLRFVQKSAHSEGEEEEETSFEEDEMPQIQREVWSAEETKGMPVLQRMDDLSPDGSLHLQSPPALPQITLTDEPSWRSGKDKLIKSKISDSQTVTKDSFHSSRSVDYQGVEKLDTSSHVLFHTPSKFSVMNLGKECSSPNKELSVPKSATRQSSMGSDKSSLFEKNDNDITESDLIQDRQFLVEPDSTSEFLICAARLRKESEASRGEGSPLSQVSPRSTTCSGPATPASSHDVHRGAEVTVRVEDSHAECDSTCMYLTSPSAISPASQGEIEERVCPVLTDHEDGASPAHNCLHVQVCRSYQSLPPPSDLVSRDHVPISPNNLTQIDQPHVSDSTTKSSRPRPYLDALKPLVRYAHSCQEPKNKYSDNKNDVCKTQSSLRKSESKVKEAALQLEKMGPSLAAESKEISKHSVLGQNPQVLTVQNEKSTEKQQAVVTEKVKSNQVACVTKPEMACSLTKQPVENKLNVIERNEFPLLPVSRSNDSVNHVTKLELNRCAANQPAENNATVAEDLDFVKASESNDRKRYGLLVVPDRISSEKRTGSKKQPTNAARSNFTMIDQAGWDSAVAIVENSASRASPDGENKPGIILKIRRNAAVPNPCSASETLTNSNVAQVPPSAAVPQRLRAVSDSSFHGKVDRKRHTIDGDDMSSQKSKLRKGEERRKVELFQYTSIAPEKPPQGQKKDKKCRKKMPLQKRPVRRHSTPEGDLMLSVDRLPLVDRQFAMASIKLYQLQKLTHDLLSSLSPRLKSKLMDIRPESNAFYTVVDDIIASLEKAENQDLSEELEHTRTALEKMSLESDKMVPVYLPDVTLCRSPQHAVEEFQDKVCPLLQLMFPDVGLSFSESMSKNGDDMIAVLLWAIRMNMPQELFI